MNTEDRFRTLAEELARDEAEKIDRLLAAGYHDLVDKVRDGEIDIFAAMQIFDGRRP
jgi:hypothetical protein